MSSHVRTRYTSHVRERCQEDNAMRLRAMAHFPMLSKSNSDSRLFGREEHSIVTIVHDYQRPKFDKHKSSGNGATFLGAPKELLRSGMCSEINALEKYRAQHLMRHEPVPKRSIMKETSSAGMKKATLEKVQQAIERISKSRYSIDLRGFEGASMTAEQFKRQLRSQLGLVLSQKECDILVEHLDEDKNGLVDYKEVMIKFLNTKRLTQGLEAPKDHLVRFNKVMDAICQAKQKHAKRPLRALFRDFDNNRDGQVTKSEFTRFLMEKMGVRLERYQVEQVFHVLARKGAAFMTFEDFAYAFYNRRAHAKLFLSTR